MNSKANNEYGNSKNIFELDGNVSNVNDIYENHNGKKSSRFDLAQNNNGEAQFVPIVLRGELVNSYGNEIKKGDWISVKGRIATYSKDVEKNGKSYKNKVIDILGFEITDRKNNKVYTSDGQVQELSSNIENDTKMER